MLAPFAFCTSLVMLSDFVSEFLGHNPGSAV